MGFERAQIFIFLAQIICSTAAAAAANPAPLNCTDTKRLCTSFLAFNPTSNQTLLVIQSMFDVLQEDITVEGNGRDCIFVKKNCSCSVGLKAYLTNTTFTVRANNGSAYDLVMDSYHGLAYIPSNHTRPARRGSVVALNLVCGCSSGLWNYLMSYVMQDGDSVESLASRFGVSMDSIVTVNGLPGPDNVTVGALYYIPLNSVPGEPYPIKNNTLPAPAPAPDSAPLADNFVAVDHNGHKARARHWWIIGSVAGGLALVIIFGLLFISSRCLTHLGANMSTHSHGKVSHKFHILRNTSFCCARRRSRDWDQSKEESNNRHLPTIIGTNVFDVEKPVVFTYEDILSSTDGFSDSNLLGHGTYGSVYYGLLQDQDVAVKKMTATKTKEFTAEMKVLCKVHHTNLIELIGYAATEDELFLIYEFAQKGSLTNHLHDPHTKGHTSLSWITRVKIALDAARGLEYIHEHTKPHYVHRDIKTSNILLDSAFSAKISDFGMAKLVLTANDGEESVTRVVGTYGYLAPEYLRDGIATTKIDVYAYGVVLLELISGKEAMTRTAERRSLASIMVAALRNSPDFMTMSSLKDHIDPSLMDLYPNDCLFKMSMLAKQCVDDDPILRPDMKQVVIALSQILLSSVEWEATLAGNSQIFSGLVQGR